MNSYMPNCYAKYKYMYQYAFDITWNGIYAESFLTENTKLCFSESNTMVTI